MLFLYNTVSRLKRGGRAFCFICAEVLEILDNVIIKKDSQLLCFKGWSKTQIIVSKYVWALLIKEQQFADTLG